MPVVNVHGTSLHYTDKGTGTAIIFIHPPVLSSKNFIAQLDDLSRYFRVIAFDIRGHGKSEASKTPITYPLIAEDIKALMDHLDIRKAFFCGYSTGGSIVLECLLAHPERSHGGIVISGMSEVNTKQVKNLINTGLLLSKAKAIRAIALGVSWSNSINLRHFLELYQDAKHCNALNAEQYYQYSLIFNCTEQLGEIKLPVLLVYGEKDRSFLPYAHLLARRLPNHEFHMLPKVDHRVPTKAFAECNTLIQKFIKKLVP